MEKIIAKHPVYRKRFKIDQNEAFDRLSEPLILKFMSLDEMLTFLERMEIISNSIHFKIEILKATRSWRQSDAFSESIYQSSSDIYDAFEKAGFDIHEADTAFLAIESSLLITNRNEYHAKVFKCRIGRHTYKFYFDILNGN